MPDPVCHSKACAASACPRSVHRYGYERGMYRYLKCSTHRACAEFEDVEPLHGWLMEANDGLVDALGSVIDTEAGLRQVKAAGIQTAPVEEQPVLIEEVVTDGRRLSDEPERITETSAPATGGLVERVEPFDDGCSITLPSIGRPVGRLALKRVPLASWNSWWCKTCGARAFNARNCCNDKPMVAVRMVMYAREVTDG